jgi:DNA-binding MarR family transcriptional regulator
MREKPGQFISLHKMPNYETLQRFAERYPELDPDALTASLTLLCVGTQLQEAFSSYFLRHRLSHGRFRVLVMLLRAGEAGLSPAELAERTGVTRATMTGLLDSLAADSLIHRRENPQDRRQKQVDLSPKGRRMIERLLPDHFRRVTALMAGLTPDELSTLVQLLNKVAPGLPALSAP